MRPILPALNRNTDDRAVYANRYRIALTVTLGVMLEVIDSTVVSVATPSMMGTLGATLDEIAWVMTAYVVANVIVLPISSWLSDLLGRRNYFALSILLFTVSSVLCGTSSSVEELVFWRVIQGLGGGGLMSTSQVIMMDAFPPNEAARGLAIWGVGVMLGPAIGPTLGGWITDAYTWPWIFYINVPFGMMGLALALMYVPDSRNVVQVERVDAIGLLLLVVGVGSVQALLERGQRLDWFDSREAVAWAIAGGGATIALVWHELRCDHPIINLRVFRDRQFSVSIVMSVVFGALAYVPVFAFPVYLQTLLGYTALQSGMAQLPFVVATALTFAVIGKPLSNPQVDLRWVMLAGLLLFGESNWLAAQCTLQSGSNDFFMMMVVRGCGSALVMLPATQLVTATVAQIEVAGGNGIFNLARMLGSSLGIALFATLLEKYQHLNRGELMRHVTAYAAPAQERMQQLGQLAAAHGAAEAPARQMALQLLDNGVTGQATMISFNQIYMIFVYMVLLAMPMLALMKTGKARGNSVAIH